MSNRTARTDPAEGSREVIKRELARQEHREAANANSARRPDTLSRQDVLVALRDADDCIVAEIVDTGASLEEFGEAVSWITDDAVRDRASAPSGRVARLIDLLRIADADRVGSAGDPL